MRLLAPVRLSRDTDSTTSPASQRASISDYAQEYGHSVVWTDVEDRNISGAVPIRERPGIGPWLAPDKIGSWDAICGHEMDRISRDMLDYLTFCRDITALGKVVIDVSDGTDTSTRRGRQILEDRILAAQRERERMQDRRQRAQARLRKVARWGGGVPPYGYRPVRLEETDEKGKLKAIWHLVPDEAQAAVIRHVAAEIIAGRALSSMVVELNKAGTLSSHGRPWKATTLRKILRSDTLRGYVLHYPPRQPGRPVPAPVVVLGEDGQPVTREPVLDDQTWRRLQQALDRNAIPDTARRANPSLLLRVAYCGLCWRPLYRLANRGYVYYRCAAMSAVHAGAGPRCESRMIQGGLLEEAAGQLFLDTVGRDSEIVNRVPVPGEDHAAQIDGIDENIRRLDDEYAGGQLPARAYSRMISRLESRREALAALPVRPAGVELVPTGRTFGQAWDAGNVAGRQALMRDASFRVLAQRGADDVTTVMSLGDAEMAERARAAAGGEHPPAVELPGPDSAGHLGFPLRMVAYGPAGSASWGNTK